MSRPLAATLVLLALPTWATAQDAPERHLPAGTQFLLRWDGFSPHRAAYEKTALGKTLQGDTGKFLAGLSKDLGEGLRVLLTVPQLLEGILPAQLQKIQADVAEAPKLIPTLLDHGFLLGFEVRNLNQVQLTLILPGAGAKPGPFFSSLRLLTVLNKLEAKEVKLTDRTVQLVADDGGNLFWWTEGKEAFVVFTTDKPEMALQHLQRQTAGVTDQPQFKKLQEFKQFETGVRGFLDVAALVKQGQSAGKEVSQVLDDLGLTGVKAVRFHAGFDGPAFRTLVEVDTAGPRKGLLRLTGARPFKVNELPALPADLHSFTALRIDAVNFYDVALQTMQTVVALADPAALPEIKKSFKQADDLLGLSIRADLLGTLGDLAVTYSTPGEGPFGLAQTILIQVKDAKKLERSLEQSLKAFADLAGVEIQVKKRPYRDTTLHEVHVRSMGFIFLPTYAIHNGWLIVGFYPQSVQGAILRASGELPAWKPGPDVQSLLDRLPSEVTVISMSDPRPTIKQVLSVTPFIAQAFHSFAPDSTKFDVGAIPNAHEATRHLFPNVSVATDDGGTLRWQSCNSLPMPIDLGGLDIYVGLLVFSLLVNLAK